MVGVAVFLVVVLALVSLLLVARNKLVPRGNVTIKLNGEREVSAAQGGSLLSTLAEQNIFLPSACGGKGSCGMCRCKVVSGGGSILPTETGFFSHKEQAENWRLGCQVKVRGDMEVEINPQIFGIKKWECEVVSNRNVSTFIKELIVRLPEGETLDFESGSYIQIDVPPVDVDYKDIEVGSTYAEEWERLGMRKLRMRNREPQFRAYSMANQPSENNVVMLNVRIATPPFDRASGTFKNVNPGVCSSYIFSLKAGDRITLSGPYGEFHIKPTDNEMMFIGGGVGMAPMRSHIFDLFGVKRTTRKASFWYGARSLKEMFYEDDFRRIEAENPNFSFHVALSEPRPEDNWNGLTGFIHQAVLDNYLKNHPAPEDIEYYLCGPPLMISSVLAMLDNLGVPKDNILFDDFGN